MVCVCVCGVWCRVLCLCVYGMHGGVCVYVVCGGMVCGGEEVCSVCVICGGMVYTEVVVV